MADKSRISLDLSSVPNMFMGNAVRKRIVLMYFIICTVLIKYVTAHSDIIRCVISLRSTLVVEYILQISEAVPSKMENCGLTRIFCRLATI